MEIDTFEDHREKRDKCIFENYLIATLLANQ